MIITPETTSIGFSNSKSVFLAGTIDNGNSVDWQSMAGELLDADDRIIFNPRRANWDSLMSPTSDNPKFVQQVAWEYDALTIADIILFNFLPNSKSPITLLELGLFADSGKCVVVCPDEFYRQGNVIFICAEYEIPLYKHMSDGILQVDKQLNKIKKR